MPVFSVKEVARAARKDEKTIRLWCERDFVAGAKRKRGGKGRHWRLHGESAAAIAAKAHERARGFSRRRKTKLEAALQKFPKFAKSMRRRLAGVQFSRSFQAQMRIVGIVSECLMERPDEMLDELELTRGYVERFAELPLQEDCPKVFTAALCVWMLESGKGSASGVARCSGISRRTLQRHFAPYWDGASAAVSRMKAVHARDTGAWRSAGIDKKTGAKLSEREGTTMPAGQAAESEGDHSLRAWSGALRNESFKRGDD